MIEVRKVLRAWLSGSGYPTVAARAGVDRKTARHYVDAAVAAGLGRECGVDQRSDELIGAVVAAVRPDRPHGYGVAWELLCANHDQIEGWVKKGLSVVKIVNLLARRGHMFVWLAFSQTLQAVIDGCEAAWRLFGGVFRVLIPDNIEYCCGPCRFGEPEVHRRLAGIQPSSRLRDRPGAGEPTRRTTRAPSGWCSTCGTTSSPGRTSPIWPTPRRGTPRRPANASTPAPVPARRNPQSSRGKLDGPATLRPLRNCVSNANCVTSANDDSGEGIASSGRAHNWAG